MDSGFCVLKALIELYNQGIFGSAVIKKRRFWPKYIDGDAIDKRFEDRNVGTVEDHPGTLGGVPFKVFVLKEEDYSMKLMATYGARTEVDGGATQRSITTWSGEKATVTFKYMEPFFNHFKYRHQVDDHNNMRHSPISLEESLSTKDWKIRVFSFILAIVEVNARLAFCRWISTNKSVTQLEFRRLLAKELLELSFRARGRPRQRLDAMVRSNCGEEMAPKYAGAWTGKEWKKLSTMYPQHVCKTLNCNRRIRTYCRCNVGYWMCSTCIGIHIASKDNDISEDD
jgi:Transposase IS4